MTFVEMNAKAVESQAHAAEMDAKINRSISLVAGFGGEGKRWKAKIAAFNEETCPLLAMYFLQPHLFHTQAHSLAHLENI